MSRFFAQLEEKKLLPDYVEALDWLFSGEKMQGWSRAHKSSFTKQIKTLPHFSKKTFHYNDDTPYPNPQKSNSRPKKPLVIMKSRNGEGRDFITHLRNAIAHGNALIYGVGNKGTYLEAKDFKTDSKRSQTAYVAVPLQVLNDLMHLYRGQEKKIANKSKC